MAKDRTILLAEDDDLARNAVTRYLILKLLDAGYDAVVIGARDGSHARMLLEARASDRLPMVDLVITDLDMPVMNGLELVKEVKAKYPRIPIFLWSGRAKNLEDFPQIDLIFDKTDIKGLLAAIAARFALTP